MSTPSRNASRPAAGRRVVTIVAWPVLLVSLSLLTIMVVVPRIAGATPYTVLSGSMEPTYSPGTLVVAKPAEAGDLGVGTPVTYQLESGEPAVVTHRIVEVLHGVDGSARYVTQGDANDVADEKPVRPVQVRGEVWYAVPFLGYLNNALTDDQHAFVVVLVAAGLFVYAAAMLISAAAGRRRDAGASTGRVESKEPAHV